MASLIVGGGVNDLLYRLPWVVPKNLAWWDTSDATEDMYEWAEIDQVGAKIKGGLRVELFSRMFVELQEQPHPTRLW